MEAIDGDIRKKTESSYYTSTASSTSMDGQTNMIYSAAGGKAADVQNIINPTNSLTVEGHKESLISSALSSGQSNAYVILPPTIDLSHPDALSALQTIASMNVRGAKTSGEEGENDTPSTSMDRGNISGDYEPVSTNYSITTNMINEKQDVKSPTSADVDMVKGSKSNPALSTTSDPSNTPKFSTTNDLLSAIFAVMALQIQQSSDQRQIVNQDARFQRLSAYDQSQASFHDKITAAEKQKTADQKNAQSEIASGIAGIAGGVAGLGMSITASVYACKAFKNAGKLLNNNAAATITQAQADVDKANNLSKTFSAMSQSVSTLCSGIGSTISGSIKLESAEAAYVSRVQSAMAELASAMMQTFISNMQADQSSYSASSQNIESSLSLLKQFAQMMYDQLLTLNRNI